MSITAETDQWVAHQPRERQALQPSALQPENLPAALRPELLPALETLVQQVHPQGLWLYSCGEACGYGSWARGTASRRSDIDLLLMGLEHGRLLDAYDVVLEALQPCRLPL